MRGVIYCYHCISTGKKYIGQTDNEKRRKYEHSSYYNKKYRDNKFYRAVKKYGWENFIYGIIENANIETLDAQEIYFINFYNTYKNGYNSSIGGKTTRGYKHTEETKRKISESRKEKNYKQKHTEETKQLLREMKLGLKHSEESKQKMRKYKIKYLYEIKSPEGKIYIIDSLNHFCKLNGLDSSAMLKVCSGKQSSHLPKRKSGVAKSIGWTGHILEKLN